VLVLVRSFKLLVLLQPTSFPFHEESRLKCGMNVHGLNVLECSRIMSNTDMNAVNSDKPSNFYIHDDNATVMVILLPMFSL
jgi:hypothetical protein